MLWWGMDKSLVELFAHHPDSLGFEENPLGWFRAEIEGKQMRADIGLFGGQYTIVFLPGERVKYPWVVLSF